MVGVTYFPANNPVLAFWNAIALLSMGASLVRDRIKVLWFISLPGMVLHELAHWVTGFFLNAHPLDMVLFPERVGRSWALGHVKFGNIRWYNSLVVGLAPLSLFALGYYFLSSVRPAPDGQFSALSLLTAFMVVQCFLSGMPSGQDWTVAFSPFVRVGSARSGSSRPGRSVLRPMPGPIVRDLSRSVPVPSGPKPLFKSRYDFCRDWPALLAACGGDVAKADRLVGLELRRSPSAAPDVLVSLALSSLRSDRW